MKGINRWEVTESGCWLWLGSLDKGGYGQWNTHTKAHKAHRRVYEERVGPIPDGMTLDHLCRNRACVNPDHLEPVTRGENVLRGEGITAQLAKRTHCANGHELTEANTYRWGADNARRCRVCRAAADRRFKERRQA